MPKLAQEAHANAMQSTVQAALQQAGISEEQLEGVAVTVGPGLSLCLQVGICLGEHLDMRISPHAMRLADACHTSSAAGATWHGAKAASECYVCRKMQLQPSREGVRSVTCRW